MIGYKILFLASGTLGDIQPYVALGIGLKAAGISVGVVTHPEFRQLVESSGLEYAPLYGNPSEPMTRPGGQSALTYDGNPVRSLRASLVYLRRVRPIYQRMLESAWQACQDLAGGRPSAIVAGLPTTWSAHIAEALGAACIWAFLQPVTRTRAYPSALLPSTFSLGPAYNRLSHLIVEWAMLIPRWSLVRTWRVKTLGLRQAGLNSPLEGIYSPEAYVLYGYSPVIAPSPPDWPPHHHITGYWTMPPDDTFTPPPGLEKFLGSGPPPLYVGFGSPGNRNPQKILQIALGALEITGQRAVLAYPPDLAGGVSLLASVHLAPQVLHDWLFPRMAGLIHHGGAGTSAAGLRAGMPTLAAPLAVDQFFWGQRMAALGCGPEPIAQRDLTVSRLSAAIQSLVGNERYRASATRIKGSLLAEDGIAQAVKWILGWI